MLEVRNLECIRGERRLFQDVSFRLQAGELLFLQGRNGSGKTSLLRILVGLTPPASGEIFWDGTPIRRLGASYREQLCYLGHQNAIKDEMTPLENLMSGSLLTGANQPMSEGAALDALAKLGLASRADLPSKFLSQGQKRRVALARLVHEKRRLWVLDEAFVALDTAAVELVAGLIGAHLQQGGVVAMTTHQRVEIPGSSGRIRDLTLTEAS